MVNFIAAISMGQVNWGTLQTSHGTADDVPWELSALVDAETEDEARESYWSLDNVVVIQTQLFEAAVPLVPVLLSLLAGSLSPVARYWIIELLLQIGLGTPHEEAIARGHADLGDRCRGHLREGLWLLYQLLQDSKSNTRSAALQLIVAADTDRQRSQEVLQFIAEHDADARMRKLAVGLLEEHRQSP